MFFLIEHFAFDPGGHGGGQYHPETSGRRPKNHVIHVLWAAHLVNGLGDLWWPRLLYSVCWGWMVEDGGRFQLVLACCSQFLCFWQSVSLCLRFIELHCFRLMLFASAWGKLATDLQDFGEPTVKLRHRLQKRLHWRLRVGDINRTAFRDQPLDIFRRWDPCKQCQNVS